MKNNHLRIHRVSRADKNTVLDLVFIHGITGDEIDTWQNSELDIDFWPGWLDVDMPNVFVSSIGYPSKKTQWLLKGPGMSVSERAESILDYLVVNGFGNKPIIFICHSLGGILVKQLLLSADLNRNDSWKNIYQMTAGIVLFSVPNDGSSLATLLSVLPDRFSSKLTRQLSKGSDILYELSNWFSTEANLNSWPVISFYELKPYLGTVVIVTRESANPHIVGSKPKAIDEDHEFVCKLKSRIDPNYLTVKYFVSECLSITLQKQVLIRTNLAVDKYSTLRAMYLERETNQELPLEILEQIIFASIECKFPVLYWFSRYREKSLQALKNILNNSNHNYFRRALLLYCYVSGKHPNDIFGKVIDTAGRVYDDAMNAYELSRHQDTTSFRRLARNPKDFMEMICGDVNGTNVSYIAKFAQHEDPLVRKELARVIHGEFYYSGFNLLLELLEDEDDSVRFRAAVSIPQFLGQGHVWFISVLEEAGICTSTEKGGKEEFWINPTKNPHETIDILKYNLHNIKSQSAENMLTLLGCIGSVTDLNILLANFNDIIFHSPFELRNTLLRAINRIDEKLYLNECNDGLNENIPLFCRRWWQYESEDESLFEIYANRPVMDIP